MCVCTHTLTQKKIPVNVGACVRALLSPCVCVREISLPAFEKVYMYIYIYIYLKDTVVLAMLTLARAVFEKGSALAAREGDIPEPFLFILLIYFIY